MRIWQLCPPRELFSIPTGGAVATVVAEVSRSLVAAGHDVTVAARVDGTALHETGGRFVSLGTVPWPTSAPLRIRWNAEALIGRAFGWTWGAYASYLAALRREVRRAPAPIDVVVVHNDPLAVRYVRRWAPQATVVLWLHNLPQRRPRHRRAADRPHLVVTVSDYLAGHVPRLLALAGEPVVTIHNGVDTSTFFPRPNFDQPSFPVRVLCLGRVTKNKGPDVALAAVRLLGERGIHVAFDVVGSPWFSPTPGAPPDPWGEQFLADLRAAGGTHLSHVPRDEVPSVVRAHDVACVLSRWDDPFPLVVQEAMASGCAVIATGRGGIPEAAGGAARLVPSDDPEAVAGVLREFVEQPDTLVAAKRAAVAHAKESTWGRAADRFLEALETTRGDVAHRR